MSKDYYKTLGIAKNASPDEIKRAYRKLAQQYHPDKGGDQAKFKEVNEAYQVLSDPQKRPQYDQFGSTFEQARAGGGFQGFEGFRDFSSFAEAFGQNGNNGGFDFGDIFGDIFGGRSGRASRRGNERRGRNISVDAEILLENAFNGVVREFNLLKNIVCSHCQGFGAEPGSKMKECPTCHGQGQIERRVGGGFFSFSQVETCPECQGAGEISDKKCSRCQGEGRVKENKTIKIKIPAGIQTGQVINLEGEGEAAPKGGRAGDLYVTVHVKPDPRFVREGDNLMYDLPISFSQAAIGDKVEIPTLSGWVNLKIPEGIESGTTIRLEDKGMPHLHRRGFGDMMVKIRVKTPKRLSRRAKELLEELKKEIE